MEGERLRGGGRGRRRGGSNQPANKPLDDERADIVYKSCKAGSCIQYKETGSEILVLQTKEEYIKNTK